MPNHFNDTIAAIATPQGLGGIGIIRLSGPESLTIAKAITHRTTITPRYAHYATFYDDTTHATIDDGIVLYFQGPSSYTGEDIIEFQGHGSSYALQKLLQTCLSLGASLAKPGEFTKRAFINGKLNLSQAESVIDLIHSTTEKSHAVSLSHLKGALFEKINLFRTQLLYALEQIEASIDFPDEVDPIDKTEFKNTLQTIQNTLQNMIDLQDYGEHINTGVKCIIVGRPNVGKSSLFNALLGKERAIVTDIEGTTRDYIEAGITLGGIQFKFFDTAGLRDSNDYIEYLGIQKIQELITSADLILWVVDQSQPLTENDKNVLNIIKDSKVVYCIHNKTDKPDGLTTDDKALLKNITNIALSAITSEGLDTLKRHLHTDFIAQFENIDLDLICNTRQIACLKQTQSHVDSLLSAVENSTVDDMLSVDIRQAIEKLGEITGDDLTEELLDNIFDRFCIGK